MVILAELIIKLIDTGCWIFDNVKILIHCDITNTKKIAKKRLIEVNLNNSSFTRLNELLRLGEFSHETSTVETLKDLCKFMEKSLESWLAHIKSVRDEYNLINMFTIKQIVYLKSYYDQLIHKKNARSNASSNLEQVRALLFNLNKSITKNDLKAVYGKTLRRKNCLSFFQDDDTDTADDDETVIDESDYVNFNALDKYENIEQMLMMSKNRKNAFFKYFLTKIIKLEFFN